MPGQTIGELAGAWTMIYWFRCNHMRSIQLLTLFYFPLYNTNSQQYLTQLLQKCMVFFFFFVVVGFYSKIALLEWVRSKLRCHCRLLLQFRCHGPFSARLTTPGEIRRTQIDAAVSHVWLVFSRGRPFYFLLNSVSSISLFLVVRMRVFCYYRFNLDWIDASHHVLAYPRVVLNANNAKIEKRKWSSLA